MEAKSLGDRDDVLIDLESGTNAILNDHDDPREANSRDAQAKTLLDGAWSRFLHSDGCGCLNGEQVLHSGHSITISLLGAPAKGEGQFDRRSEGEGKGSLLVNGEAEKPKKKRPNKPPRPPRPQKPSPLDAADEKLVRELSELAMLKRARIERMRALKKAKNTKSTSASSANLCALIFTVLFCLLMLWQGVFSSSSSGRHFHGSPESSREAKTGLISIQFYKNVSTIRPHGSNSASPNDAEHIPSLEIHGETGGAVG